jgi:uncharacterized Zn-binding protein involved in type VI secretion
MPPAARVTDMHVCPMVTGVVPHVGGPILPPGAPTVLIDFLPAARVTDMLMCVGPPDVIVHGSAGVFINFLPAARLGDQTAHGGVIILGCPTVLIGEIGAPSPGAAGAGAVMAGLVMAGVAKPSDANASVYTTPGSPGSAEGTTVPEPVQPGPTTEKKKAPEPCSVATIKERFDKCDGGNNLWADAKQSLGKDPEVKLGPVPAGHKAKTNIEDGVITIAPTPDCCSAVGSLFFELTNAKSKSRHLAVDTAAGNGDLAREDYVKQTSRIEYDGVILLRDAFAKCRKAWGCSATATSGYESISNDFEKYYTTQLSQTTKDYYRNAWDEDGEGSYKAAYAAKHPPPGKKAGH